MRTDPSGRIEFDIDQAEPIDWDAVFARFLLAVAEAESSHLELAST